MNINDLFSTPEQGRRLKELASWIKPVMLWARHKESDEFDACPIFQRAFIDQFNSVVPKGINVESIIDFAFSKKLVSPALTIQELISIVDDLASVEVWQIGGKIYNMTAPDLAEWIIERIDYERTV